MSGNVQDLYTQMCAFGALIEKEVKDMSQTWYKRNEEKESLTLSREHVWLAEQILTERVSTANILVDLGKHLECGSYKGGKDKKDKTLHHIVSKIERSLE